MKYDIFISYRRKESSGRSNVPMARTFKLDFERRGFKVFFDYSECTDNYFSETILPAIRTCDYFVLVLSKECLSRCFNEGDWVRREIEEALANNIKIIPITPDNECDAWPNLPVSLSKLDGLQITTIHTDQMFELSVDYLVKNRFHKDIDEERIVLKEENERPIIRQERIEVKLKDTPENEKLVTVNGIPFRMIFVKGGTFWMGAHDDKKIKGFKMVPDESTPNFDEEAGKDESPVHKVSLSGFYIGETEVTQSLWKAVMNSNPSRFLGDDLPVERVSWKECKDFIEKLNVITGLRFRLPTEAEWEFAARGGNETRRYKYAGDENIDAVAWFKDNGEGKTHPVKEKKSNEIGLYDMSGNVWEWCEDYYWGYGKEEQTNPIAVDGDFMHNKMIIRHRVIRGGGFDVSSKECRITCRSKKKSPERDCNLGFRVVLSEVCLERVKRLIDIIPTIGEWRDGKMARD